MSSYLSRSASAIVDTTNVAGAAFFGGYGNPLGDAYPSSYDNAVPTDLLLHQTSLTQELRVTSLPEASPLKWVAGVFYSRLRRQSDRYTYSVLAPTIAGINTDDLNVDTELAAFGQVALALGPGWQAGVGTRVGSLRRQSTEHLDGFAIGGPQPVSQVNQAQSLPTTPRFELSYQRDDLHYYYATVSKGFRVGGGTPGGAPLCGGNLTPTAFGPDSVWSYEVGAKDTLPGDACRSLAASITCSGTTSRKTPSTPAATAIRPMPGARPALAWTSPPTRTWGEYAEFKFALSYLDVHYTRTVLDAAGHVIVERGSVVGGVPSVPAPWSGSFTAQYHWPCAAGSRPMRAPWTSSTATARGRSPNSTRNQPAISPKCGPTLRPTC